METCNWKTILVAGGQTWPGKWVTRVEEACLPSLCVTSKRTWRAAPLRDALSSPPHCMYPANQGHQATLMFKGGLDPHPCHGAEPPDASPLPKWRGIPPQSQMLLKFLTGLPWPLVWGYHNSPPPTKHTGGHGWSWPGSFCGDIPTASHPKEAHHQVTWLGAILRHFRCT